MQLAHHFDSRKCRTTKALNGGYKKGGRSATAQKGEGL